MFFFWKKGHTWHEIKKIFNLGMYNYLSSSLNIVNFSMNFFYIASYGLKYHTMIIISQKLNKLNSNAFWKTLGELDESSTKEDIIDVHETFYWLNSGNLFVLILNLDKKFNFNTTNL